MDGHSGLDFVQAVALGIFLYAAFEWVTTNAEEVRDPALIPRGMLISIGVLFVACSLIAMGMSHFLSDSELESAHPQLFIGEAAFGRVGEILMMTVTALTALNTFNGAFVTSSRFAYATAREGSLPQAFTRLNERAVPWVPVVAIGGVSLLGALAVALTDEWKVIISAGAALEAMIYSIAGYCVYRLRARLPDQERPFRVARGARRRAPRKRGVCAAGPGCRHQRGRGDQPGAAHPRSRPGARIRSCTWSPGCRGYVPPRRLARPRRQNVGAVDEPGHRCPDRRRLPVSDGRRLS